jgi:uncharacterized protein YecE (DUF72 family)
VIWVGTSGFQYPEWRGSFYPEKFPEKQMLGFYTQHFQTVEINYSFYRLPSTQTIQGWVEGTPPGFKVTLKAPRRITHDSRLKECGELLNVFCDRARLLGDRLGALLFQLPGNFKKKPEVLDTFLECLPTDLRCAFEFRSDTWFSDEIYDCLRQRNCALCIADSEKLSTPVVATADWVYFRLRDEGYGPEDIQRWSDTIRPLSERRDIYVYFKHEEKGLGPEFGRQFLARLEG